MNIYIFAGKTALVILLALLNIVSICACLGIVSFQYKLATNLDAKKKYADALKWYERAATKEYPDALAAMVRCYFDEEKHYYPDSVNQEVMLLQTETYAEKAIENKKQLHPYYMFSFGKKFLLGKEGCKDYSKAVKWFEKAEKNDSIPARFILAYCHYNGIGVKEDCAEAIRLYRSVAASVQKTAGTSAKTPYERENQQKFEKLLKIDADQAKTIAKLIVLRLEGNESGQTNGEYFKELPGWEEFFNKGSVTTNG